MIRNRKDIRGGRRRHSGGLPVVLAPCVLLATAGGAAPQSFFEDTHIVDVRMGGKLSDAASRLKIGGYELSDGEPVRFSGWYTSHWRDAEATWMTQVDDNFGIYWGLGTGERAEKYEIEPSFKFGFILRTEISRSSALVFSATTKIGGWLREDSCTADYGDIGGTQTVNCRLAASALRPAETLRYLAKEAPPDRYEVILRYTFRF